MGNIRREIGIGIGAARYMQFTLPVVPRFGMVDL